MPRIREVVDSIRRLEVSRKDAANHIMEGGFGFEGVGVEKGFLKEVNSGNKSSFVAVGVDGGMLKKEFSGVDVVLTRAVASVFHFGDGSLEDYGTIPKNVGRPEIQFIKSPLDMRSFNVSSSLLRLQKEIKVAIQAVKQEPDIVLLDGSVLPQYTERPEQGSESRKYYDEVMDMYRQLFQESERRNVLLAGVVEDSRSSKLCEQIMDNMEIGREHSEVLGVTGDTNFLEYVMEKGERTVVMDYSEVDGGNSSMKDIGDIADNVGMFYIKTAEDATPVRIDFFDNGGVASTAERICEYLMPLCGYSSSYGIPSVVVDADQRAKLSQEDMEMFESRLLSELGPTPIIKGLRRDNRPF